LEGGREEESWEVSSNGARTAEKKKWKIQQTPLRGPSPRIQTAMVRFIEFPRKKEEGRIILKFLRVEGEREKRRSLESQRV